MGITFAKSVRFGAVRFNFSGSGIGVSAGIPGLRLGTGPRGAYISGGIGGFRYRKSLGTGRSSRAADATPSVSVAPARAGTTIVDPNVVSSVDHETKSVLELLDSNSDALLQSMNEQRKKLPMWPYAAVLLAVLYGYGFNALSDWPQAFYVGVLVAFIAIVFGVAWRDRMRKLTVLFYEPDEKTTRLFGALAAGVNAGSSARKLKAVATTSRYRDPKYSAGATQGLKFADASVFLGQAPGVVANISVPVLKAGRTTLAFYPDRVLAFQGSAVGAIDYRTLQSESAMARYIEAESVPSDAHVIDRTWRFVNKKGGPDRRFKNNRELPICAYNQLKLSTADGLDVQFLSSKEEGFDAMVKALIAIRLGG